MDAFLAFANEENLEAIAKLTEGYPVEYLKYNDLAGAKYEMLGMK